MREIIARFLRDRSWGDLIMGAVIGLVLTSFASPTLTPHATRFYENTGYYPSPTVDVFIQDTGEYHPIGESVYDFEGLEWDQNFTVYRIVIRNDGDNPVEQLEFTWRAPGCIVYSNTEGPSVRGSYSLRNRKTVGVFSDTPLSISQYQCTKIIAIDEGELSPGESIAVEFVTTLTFERCDVLIDLNPRNLHSLEYTWVKNGVRFDESRIVSPEELNGVYKSAQNTSFVGTQQSVQFSSGIYVHNFVVGVRGDSIEKAVEQCVEST